MAKVRPEQLGWGLTANLAITASGNYFVFDTSGDVYLDFKGDDGKKFEIRRGTSSLFAVQDNSSVNIGGNLYVDGTISGSVTNAFTASHLQEQNVSLFRPIETPQMFVTGGFFRSSSGDWFIS